MNKSFLKKAKYSINQLFIHEGKPKAVDLAYATSADYRKNLKLSVQQLHKGGYPISHIRDLKVKHVVYLAKKWQEDGMTTATIKNRLATLRYVGRRFNKRDLIKLNNQQLGIPNRVYNHANNKAVRLEAAKLSAITDPIIKAAVTLQKLFGLRKEECLKIIPSLADKGDRLWLKDTWTKGGIERLVPIDTLEQRQFLTELRTLIPTGLSLIPTGKTYKQQMNQYNYQVAKAGLSKLHGLRHAYAQSRYRQLTDYYTHGQGWDCPKQGGPAIKQFNTLQKQIDRQAREVISNQLGHSRLNICKLYIG